MRSKAAERIMQRVPEETKIYVRWYGDLIVRINEILAEKGWSQKELSERLDKKPSEINKWLKGEHNFTLRSLAKLQAELEEPILEVPHKKKTIAFIDGYTVTTRQLTVYKKATSLAEIDSDDWVFADVQKIM
ncbi:MAG: helix-turn-helix transcriptional regulator [Saprospiraceae bacterium]|nr:helix-turn-helix transcriptional regulator [Saprospiraceae bacterium]